MKRLIQRWLGLDILGVHLIDIRENRLSDRKLLNNINDKISDINHNIRVHNSAIGRLIAKLDPMIGVPEDDPSRAAASKELGKDIIKRLEDDAKVHKHYGYTPGDQS